MLKPTTRAGVRGRSCTCFVGGEGGRLEVLKYAHENGCPWYMRTRALWRGRWRCWYAHANGCPWNALVLEGGGSERHLEVLKYAMSAPLVQGHVLYGETMRPPGGAGSTRTSATSVGQGDVLRLRPPGGAEVRSRERVPLVQGHVLRGGGGRPPGGAEVSAHENGCPWDERTCSKAAWRPPGGAEVRTKWASVGQGHVLRGGEKRPPGGAEVRARERAPWDEETCSKEATWRC